MRERPILFSGLMVRALLAGTKTQTRRILKSEHADDASIWRHDKDGVWESGIASGAPGSFGHGEYVRCPYGLPGDRLWVRENFRLRADQDDKKPSEDWWKSGAWYAADPDSEPSGCGGGAGKLRPSIFMPRWASRLTLAITGVRVEQLQDISASDAVAEGVVDDAHGWDGNPTYPLARFRSLWQEINGTESWKANPWVWVVEFKLDQDAIVTPAMIEREIGERP